jgi:hypothetical protein
MLRSTSLPSHVVAAVILLTVPAVAHAQRPDAKALQDAQRQAMTALSMMDGIWRGPATTQLPGGAHSVTQTERIGSFLGGTLKVIEGRGYNADGTVGFNAFGVISYDPQRKAYEFRSYAMGQAGTFTFRPTATGYVWEIPAGPMTIRYAATITKTTWNEVGDRIVPGKEPVRFFEMNLSRAGDTDWPLGTPVPPK